jgi:ABC-type bacteriocin/lantibiotic exporter with double-glycine peptidase domain
MPNLVQLPHYQQSAAGYCLPACIRMILSGQGLQHSEAEITKIIGAQAHGAPSYSVMRLQSPRLHVEYRSWSIVDVLSAIRSGTPAIAFVRTQFLDYWQEDVAHAVVIVGAEPEEMFWVHDPMLATGPVTTLWNGLLAGWAEFSYRGATLRRR